MGRVTSVCPKLRRRRVALRPYRIPSALICAICVGGIRLLVGTADTCRRGRVLRRCRRSSNQCARTRTGGVSMVSDCFGALRRAAINRPTGFLAMATDQPIPVGATDLSALLAATAGVMDVSDITEGVPPGNSIRLRGRLLMLPDVAYRLVAERMRPLGRTPVLRRAEQGDGQEILALPMMFGHARQHVWPAFALFVLTVLSCLFAGAQMTEGAAAVNWNLLDGLALRRQSDGDSHRARVRPLSDRPASRLADQPAVLYPDAGGSVRHAGRVYHPGIATAQPPASAGHRRGRTDRQGWCWRCRSCGWV